VNRRVSTVMVDVLLLMLLVFVLLPHKPEDAKENAQVGQLAVEIRWADGLRTDVDLWVRAPGDRPVGYSRTRGRFLSLLRDDIGNDRAPWRHEIIAGREVPDGEYQANLHLYSDAGGHVPLRVDIVVWYKHGNPASTYVVWSGSVDLKAVGHELTVVRWRMDDGRFVPGSIHYTQEPLRNR
jgi:hypothetical protein